MKLSRIQQIIKEEVAKALNETHYADTVGNAIKADAKGKSQDEIIALISDYLKKDGNTPTERSNLMNDPDFIPDVLAAIKSIDEKKSGEKQEYVYEYAYWVREDEYEFDTVGVYASNEKEARDKAYAEAKKEHPHLLRSSKEQFMLRSPKK